MWIYTDDSVLNLNDCISFYIEQPFPGDKYYLLGHTQSTDKDCVLQAYSTDDNAKRALSRLVSAIESDKIVFRMPKDEDLGMTFDDFIQEYLKTIE